MVSFILPLFLLAMWFANTAPVFNLPLILELWAFAVGLILAALGAWRKERLAHYFYLAAAIALLWTAIRAGIAFKSHDAWAQTCQIMPGTLQKLECVFQAGIDQNYAFRTFSYVIAATALFFGAYGITLAGKGYRVVIALATIAILFAAISTVATAYKVIALVPPYVIFNEFRWLRMTQLMQNPTWIWPYLLPGALCLIHLQRQTGRFFLKIPLWAALSLIAWVCLMTQQRGAFLMIIALLLAWLLNLLLTLTGRLQKRGKVLKAGVVFGSLTLFVAGLVVMLFNFQRLGQSLVEYGMVTRAARQGLTGGPRSAIWSTAYSLINDRPFFGYGYASWFVDYGTLALKRKVPLLDTAHNYFVQSVFELGAIQTVFHLTILLSGIYLAWAFSKNKTALRRQLIFTLCGYAVVLFVQEFDFIRSALYAHALYWGWLLGCGTDSSRQPGANVVAPMPKPRRTGRTRRLLSGLATVLFALGIALLFWFSLAGFQYEANVHNRYQPRVRWLRQTGTLNFVLPKVARQHGYALYDVGSAFTPAYQLRQSLTEPAIRVDIHKGYSRTYLPIAARGYFALPDLIQAEQARPNFGRQISLMLFWPPHISQLPLVGSSGLDLWEKSPVSSVFDIVWCGAQCRFYFIDCPASTPLRDLTVSARRPDVTSDKPLVVNVRITNDDKSKMREEVLTFENDHAPQVLRLSNGDIVDMTPASVFKTEPSSNIDRGFMLEKASCVAP